MTKEKNMASLLTVFVYTTDIENTSASDVRDALNQHGFTAEDVCVRPVADMPVKPPLVTSDGHIYSHNGNCCRHTQAEPRTTDR